MNKNNFAYFLLILTTIFWSGNFIVGKAASFYEIPPFTLNFYRWFFAGLILIPFTYKELINKKKYILICIMVLIIPIINFLIFKEKIFFSILFILLVPLTYNIFHEIKDYGFKRIFYMPFLGLIAQLNWCLGLIETFIFFEYIKVNKSNYLK